jgi:drug/metabolite transporter (DMT)-like permease
MNSRDYLLYTSIIFVWSTSWLPLKWQLGVVAPEVSILWRFIIAASICMAIAIFRRAPLRFDIKTHGYFMALGLFIFSTNFTLFYYAGHYVTSALLAVVFSAASMVNILLISLVYRTPPQLGQLIASATGLCGIALIFWPELEISKYALTALILCIIGTLSFCSGNLVSAHIQKQGISVLSANSWGMIYGCGVLAVAAMVRGHPFIIEPSALYIGSLLWLSIFGSVIAFFSYLSLVGSIGAGRAGYATLVFPVFALLISTFVEAYQWTWPAAVGITLVIAGNILMARAR